jgi:putative ABC transport system permease protein
MDNLIADIRYAVRRLARAPLFTLVAVLTLALGIGANSAIFSVVYGVLLRPLPFAAPDELVRLVTTLRGDRTWANSSTNVVELSETISSFSGVLAYGQNEATVTGLGEPRTMPTSQVSANFFDVLGVQPQRGRAFRAGENEPGATGVVVLSHATWQTYFGGTADVLGQVVTIGGAPHEVIGVMPPGFAYPSEAAFWTPITYDEGFRAESARGAFRLAVIARLAPGVTPARANEEVTAWSAGVVERFPQFEGIGSEVEPLHAATVGDLRTPLLVLLGAVGFVLLIACANIANLLLARAAARESEFAVRRALGAGRARIVQQLLAESVILGIAGGVIGLLLAVWGTDALVAMRPEGLPRADEIRVDAPVLLFSMVLAVLTGLLFGAAPALQMAGRSAAGTLRASGRGQIRGAAGARGALIVGEVALAVVLLAGAGLLINSFVRLTAVDPGFEADGAVAMRVWLPPARYADDAAVVALYDRLQENIAALPGVRAVGLVNQLPLTGIGFRLGLLVPSRPAPAPTDAVTADVRAITPGYLEAAGVPIVRGRGITAEDRAGGRPVVLISEGTARRDFPGDDPIGQQVQLTWNRGGEEPIGGEIVGIVADVKSVSLAETPAPALYLAHAQVPMRGVSIVVRGGAQAMTLASALRREAQALDPDLPIEVVPLAALVSDATSQARFYTLLLAVFAGVALLIAAAGIFGLFSYLVEQRRREIGIRMALGAAERTVLAMVMRHAGSLTLAGLVIGTTAALLLTRFLASLLYGVGTTDLATFASVAVVLVAVALAASYFPARRAARLDPQVALRAE